MLDIYFTLKEALQLWRRYFWIITAITLVTGIPATSLELMSHFHNPLYAHGVIRWVPFPFIRIYFDMLGMGAILGLLSKSLKEASLWTVIWTTVRSKTWVLYRLNLLIGLVTVLVVALPIFLVSHFVPFRILPIFLAAVFLVLIKYALAYPLVVVKNVRAAVALDESWKMTKGHFLYVAGCYLIIGLVTSWVSWSVKLLDGQGLETDRTYLLEAIVLEAINPIWILSAWCMYWRISKWDAESVVHETSTEPYVSPQY